jgi:hypothetical protein
LETKHFEDVDARAARDCIKRRQGSIQLFQTTRNVDGASLDDSYESLLLKILRGVHLSNIRGMELTQELKDDNTILLVQPLLSCCANKISTNVCNPTTSLGGEKTRAIKLFRSWISLSVERHSRKTAAAPSTTKRGNSQLLETACYRIVGNEVLAGEELQGLSTAYHCRQSRGCFIFGSIASLLYEWISSQIRSSGNMSYVKHQRVCLQLDDHPDHTEWTLLGSNYVIIRRGAILMVK